MLRRVVFVKGASKPLLLFLGVLLGALAAVTPALIIPVFVPPRRLVPLLSLPLPLGHHIFLVIFGAVVAASCLGTSTSPAGGTAAARGAVAATVLPRRKGLIQPLHDNGHDIIYDLLLPLLQWSLTLTRDWSTVRVLAVTAAMALGYPSGIKNKNELT